MNTLNALLTRTFDALLSPLANWPLLALLVVSAITGMLMTLVFRYTSNQRALEDAIDRGRGHLLAIKMFKDDLPGMFTSLAQVFRYVLARLYHSLVPLLVMIVPFLLLVAQLAARYEYRPLQPGESAVVQLQLAEDAWPTWQRAAIQASPGLAVETAPLRDESERAVFWRIKPTSEEISTLQWERVSAGANNETVNKQIVARTDTHPLCVVSRRRPGAGWLDRLLYPSEPGFDEGAAVESIELNFPRRTTPLLGFDVPWWLTFLVVSIAFALIMQPVFKVKF